MFLLQGFVQLPSEQQVAITALVISLLAIGFNFIGTKLPWTTPFITKYKDEISLSISAAVLDGLQNLLPSAYPQISISAVGLLLAILAVVAVKSLFKRASG